MRRIKVGCSIGLQGCKIEDVLEVDDDATQEDIDHDVKEWAFNIFEFWSEEETDDDTDEN